MLLTLLLPSLLIAWAVGYDMGVWFSTDQHTRWLAWPVGIGVLGIVLGGV